MPNGGGPLCCKLWLCQARGGEKRVPAAAQALPEKERFSCQPVGVPIVWA